MFFVYSINRQLTISQPALKMFPNEMIKKWKYYNIIKVLEIKIIKDFLLGLILVVVVNIVCT